MDPVYPRINELVPLVLEMSPKKNGDEFVLSSKEFSTIVNLVSELTYYIETQYARCAEGAASAITPTP